MTTLRILIGLWGGYLVLFIVALYGVDWLFRILRGEDK